MFDNVSIEKAMGKANAEEIRQKSRVLFARAGTAYGFIFGLSFGLLLWGYDTVMMLNSHAEFAWAKFLIGVPATTIIFTLAGRLIAASDSAAVHVTLGGIAGGLVAFIAGHLPYEGSNLAAWLADDRLWGLVVFPYGRSSAAWTTLVAILGVGMGALAGLLESLVLERAWDNATKEGKMSTQSWLTLFLCIPLVIFYVGSIEEFINQRLRLPQQKVSELVELTLAQADDATFERQGFSPTTLTPYYADMSEHYTVHLASYNNEGGFTSTYTDVAFENGPLLRCATTEIGGFFTYDQKVIFCEEILPRYAGWMNTMIGAALYGENIVLEGSRNLQADDTVIRWMESQSERFSESYELSRPSQRAGWVFISAHFDNGFEMMCRFFGTSPVRVDQCIEVER